MKEGDLIAGRYRLLRPIGSGGMATVWAAQHELLGREFALKFAAARVVEARTRFIREAQIVAKLRHPNIVDLADVGEATTGGDVYIAMELLEGVSLGGRIAERQRLHAVEAAAIAGEVASGLAAAHQAGVVHRDVKPENIFLARGSSGGIVPKLLDFGVSKARNEDVYATSAGQLLGTPAYMSPEQALGETDIDHRTDLWSLGVVLYEMLAGRHPFEAPNYQALLPRIAEVPHAPLDDGIPQSLRRIVDRCLAKDRADRFQTADALGEALEAALGGLEHAGEDVPLQVERLRAGGSIAPGADRSTGRAPHGTLSPSIHPVRPPVRGRTLLGVAAAAALLVVAAAVGIRSLRDPAPSAARPETAVPTAAPIAAAPSVTASAQVPVEIELREPPPAAAEPASSASASKAAAPARGGPQRPHPVTRVNSAGF